MQEGIHPTYEKSMVVCACAFAMPVFSEIASTRSDFFMEMPPE